MTAIARQAAVLIDNARLFEREQGQRRRTEALLNIVDAAGSSLSLEKVLISVCRSVVDLTVAERCSVFLFNAESGTLEPIMSLGAESPIMWEQFRGAAGLRIPDVRGFGIALNVQQPVIEEHVPGSGILPDFWIDSFGLKSLAIYPLMVKDATVGVIAVDSYSDFVHFPPEEVEAMTAIARQAAVVIENARLFEQEQKQRQRAEALLQVVGAAELQPQPQEGPHQVVPVGGRPQRGRPLLLLPLRGGRGESHTHHVPWHRGPLAVGEVQGVVGPRGIAGPRHQ